MALSLSLSCVYGPVSLPRPGLMGLLFLRLPLRTLIEISLWICSRYGPAHPSRPAFLGPLLLWLPLLTPMALPSFAFSVGLGHPPDPPSWGFYSYGSLCLLLCLFPFKFPVCVVCGHSTDRPSEGLLLLLLPLLTSMALSLFKLALSMVPDPLPRATLLGLLLLLLLLLTHMAFSL